jgi:hypothetical protein
MSSVRPIEGIGPEEFVCLTEERSRQHRTDHPASQRPGAKKAKATAICGHVDQSLCSDF